MAIQKELSCPHCKKPLPFGSGFEHDNELNFICFHCKKIVFGVTPKAEAELKRHVASATNSTSSVMGFYSGGHRREPLPIRLNNVQEEIPIADVAKTCDDPPAQLDDDPTKGVALEEWQCFI